MNDVTVARGNTSVDNWIETCQRSASMAWHAPESVGGAGQQGNRGRKRCDGLHISDEVDVRVCGWYGLSLFVCDSDQKLNCCS
jgi:hypothetical protein